MLVSALGDVSLLSLDGAPVPLTGTRQSALLAALTARAGQVVSIDRLVDLLWEGTPPENPAPALHSVVFKLRASLARAGGRPVLHTRDRGYLLDLGPGDLDADTFTALVAQARDQPADRAADVLEEALALWRGPAYGAFADTEIARLEALRLEEQRRSAVERCGAARLASGRAEEAVAILRPFVVDQPLREAPRATLMRALHATGRTSEGLEEYQSYRRVLADDLGLEPSPLLQSVQAELLGPAQGEAAGAAQPEASSAGQPGRSSLGTAAMPGAAPARRRGLPEMRVRYLRTDGGNVVAFGTTGSGPRVVVLLGWVSSLEVIASGRDPRSSLLERLTGDLSLTLYDRAGTGLSPGPVADYGLAASVAELGEVVRAVGPPVSLLALSSAGPVALSLAHEDPDLVESLVLVGTFADGPATFYDERLREMVVEIARSHWGLGSKLLADRYRPGLSDDGAWHLARVFRDSSSAEVAAGYLEAMYTQDVTALLPSITAPALVLHYRSDRLIGFRGAQDLAAGLPDAVLVPLDGRFHLPDAGDLDLIKDSIVQHVRRHSTASTR